MRAALARLGLRARLLLVGVLGVAAALAVGSVALYAVLTVVSYDTLDDAGRATAHEVVTLVEQGRLSDPVPVTGSQVVQVVDGRNRVVSASVNADRLTALLLPSEIREALDHPVVVPGSRVGVTTPLRVTAQAVRPAGGARRFVLVAQQFDAVVHSQRILAITLLVTYPLLLAALVLIAWRVVGSALRPVEALRATAEGISGSGAEGRLPVPPTRDEIHALAVTLNSMLDRLGASRRRERTFLADAAHELRSPLASMRTQLEVAQHLGESTALTEDLRADVSRMTGLVEGLLALARMDADQAQRPDRRPVDVTSVARTVAERHASSRVPVVVRAADDAVTAVALSDHDDLQRVLGNLVDNAVRHAAGEVEVSVRVDGRSVVVAVADDGAGIPATERDRVFERFTRLDEARDRDAGGSGLGLAIVSELVARLGGRVRLGDAEQGGLVAEVELPRAGGHRETADAVTVG